MRTVRLTLPRLHSGQARIVAEARRFNVLVCGRRWGKTTLAIDRLCHPAVRGRPVAYFSPTYKMLTEVWSETKRLLDPVTARRVEDEHRLELAGGGVVDFWSLDNPNVARGRKYALVVIDEAAQVAKLEEAWQEAIRPTLTDLRGEAWFLSTPRGFDFFERLYRRGQRAHLTDWASWVEPTVANPRIDPAEVAAARADLPDRVFSQEYLAAFVSDAAAIFKRAWWDGRNRYDPTDEGLWRLSAARFCSWDTALKDAEGNAYSARVVGELTNDYRLAIRHVYRERLMFPDLARVVDGDIAAWDRDGKLIDYLVEDRASGTSLIQTLKASLPAGLAARVRGYQPKLSKPVRAELASVKCAQGCVLLPEPGPTVPWLEDFEAELYAAPLGAYMDQVDAFAQLVLWAEPQLRAGLEFRGEIAA